MCSVYQVDGVASVSPGITHTCLPTDLNRTQSPELTVGCISNEVTSVYAVNLTLSRMRI